MSLNEDLKNKLVENKIIKKEDIEDAPNWALNLGALLLKMSEIEDYCSLGVNKFDEQKFLEEIYKVQDLIDLKNCDKVSQNYEEKMESFPIGVPVKLIPCLRQVMGELKEKL